MGSPRDVQSTKPRDKTLRVLIATDGWFPDIKGGVARVATETATRWARAGNEVVVLVPRHEQRRTETITEGGALRVIPALPRGPAPQVLTDPLFTRRHATRLGAQAFDVVVTHEPTTAYGLLAARLDAPMLYVFHADVVAESRYLRSVLPLGRERLALAALDAPLRRLTTVSLHGATSIVVLSEFSRRILARVSPSAADRATLVHGAVDTDRFSPHGREAARRRLGVSSGTKLVFTVRRLVPRMGLGELIDAVALLGDVDGLRVVIAGGGTLMGDLEARRAQRGLEGTVSLLGSISDDDLVLWHKAADLFVLPTLAQEGFGMVTVEALASGTPVVGTPVGATPELIEPLEPRLVTDGTDPISLATTLRTGLEIATPAFRKRCREYARTRFSWDAVMPEWTRLLDETARAANQLSTVASPAGAGTSRVSGRRRRAGRTGD